MHVGGEIASQSSRSIVLSEDRRAIEDTSACERFFVKSNKSKSHARSLYMNISYASSSQILLCQVLAVAKTSSNTPRPACRHDYSGRPFFASVNKSTLTKYVIVL
jgi:hypothetical protein